MGLYICDAVILISSGVDSAIWRGSEIVNDGSGLESFSVARKVCVCGWVVGLGGGGGGS